MTLLKRLSVFAAKTEAVVGTAEALTAAEGNYNVYDLVINPDIEVEQREAQGSFNHLTGIAGARGGTATFRTDVLYDGVALPTWASVLLPACGWIDTTNVFSPVSEGLKTGGVVKTLTIGGFVDGRFKSLAGAAGTFKFVMEAGKIAFIEWEFQGVWQDVTDAALIAPTYPVALPVRFAAAPTTHAAFNLCVANLEIDAGNEVILRECPDTIQGYESGLIVDRYPMITADPEGQLIADDDMWGDFLANAEAEFKVVLPSTDTSTITIAAPKAQIFTIEESDRDKLITDEIEFMCNKNGATEDQELTISFTPTA